MTRAGSAVAVLSAGAALAALAAAPAAADVYPRQPGIDAQHYVFRVTLGDTSDAIECEATLRLRFLTSGLREVALDLTSLAGGKGMAVQSVTSDGKPVAFTHRDDRLRLALAAEPAAGQEASFAIRYGGVPGEGLRVGKNIHGERTVFSDNWPDKAHQWLPLIDHPYDKTTGELIVTAPAQYQVVSNGLLVEELDLGNGLRRTHWKQSVPIASWLWALGVARFAVHHAGLVKDVPLQTWVFPQEREKGYALFEATSRNALELFSDRIGPYSYEKLASVQASGISGGMELASAIFYGEKDVAEGRSPVVHEIAHQWFGDSVTERDWDDVWLSEGFATYFALLYTEHFEGRDAFVAALKRSREQVLKLEASTPDTPVVHRNLSDMRRVLNQLVYQKGAFTLHMLRGLVGTDAFWAGIREYYRRYRNQNASTDELRLVMEQASGQELGWFFRQWLNCSGVPRLEGRWSYDAAAHQVELKLAQTQAGDRYRLPVEVALVGPAEQPRRIERVLLSERTQTFRLAIEFEPAAVVLDPATWLLMESGPFTKEPKPSLAQAQPWPAEKANAWYAAQPWLVGSNYVPASAINQLEMWQSETFDPKRIDAELGWAAGTGMNTMRVFLHDLPWQQDAKGFVRRIDAFLTLAKKHGIRPMFVLFDSCWDPRPRLGKQREPRPGVHNSGWVQSPALQALLDDSERPRLEAYVKGVVAAFASDDRVLAWDMWNEPDNLNAGSYADPKEKLGRVQALLPQVFDWARASRPKQPLTSGVWKGDWSSDEKLDPVQSAQLRASDVISFHSYDKPEEFEKRVASLRRFSRPVLCTEYMARPRGSTFEAVLPVAKRLRVAAYNWGFVAGKSQTNLPWDSWQRPYVDRQPDVWFHDVFRPDGSPYRAEEVALIRLLTGRRGR